jgi:hypothetical protein
MRKPSMPQRTGVEGHILLAALALVLILSLLGMTSLYLAGQDATGVRAMRAEKTAQRFADAAADVVMSWFHDPAATPTAVAALLAKQQGDEISGPSFFDAAGRSQFRGTVDRPDLLLDSTNPADDRILNEPRPGFGPSLRGLGRILTLRVYGPMRPGLLCTMDVTAATMDQPPVARTLQVQLGAIAIPAVRAAVQVGQTLGSLQPSGESPILVHWGDHRVMGDLTVRRVEDLVLKSTAASVTGLPYDPLRQEEDRWAEYRIGGNVVVTNPPPGQGMNPPLSLNVHVRQHPSPGVRLDRWDYDQVKNIARQVGTYYRLDRQGRLHADGADASDPGFLPSDVLTSDAVGDHRGLVFIDTVDGEAPRADNLGTLVLETEYVEGLLVVQGHVIARSRGTGQSVPVLSPPEEGRMSLGTRIPVQLTGINLNGVLIAAGTITFEQSARIFGALMAGDTVRASGTSVKVEIWYNADLAQGLHRGLPVVFRAPGTWQMKY